LMISCYPIFIDSPILNKGKLMSRILLMVFGLLLSANPYFLFAKP